MFAHRVEAERVLLFHHDPMHTDDFLDAFHGAAVSGWQALGGDPTSIEMGVERQEIELAPAAAA
jgi:hypothetical protein